jgi:GntR family transcriptional regulator
MHSRVPLARRVRDAIRSLMLEQQLAAGAQLPPEAELAARFGVARTTVREAYKLLEQDGLVNVVHGRGRFVSELAALGVDRPISRFESVTEMLASLGHTVENEVLAVREQPADDEQAEALELASGEPVIWLERLRLSRGRVLIYSIDVIDAAALADPLDELDWSGSVVALLAEGGAVIQSSAAQIRAARLPAGAPSLPGLEAGEPWLLISERCVGESGRPVLYALDYHRGDIFSFHVNRRRFEDATGLGDTSPFALELEH